MLKENFKNKGITLLSLILTVIIMLILTGVALSIALGENGIIDKANEAVEATQIATDKELLLSYRNLYRRKFGRRLPFANAVLRCILASGPRHQVFRHFGLFARCGAAHLSLQCAARARAGSKTAHR